MEKEKLTGQLQRIIEIIEHEIVLEDLEPFVEFHEPDFGSWFVLPLGCLPMC